MSDPMEHDNPFEHLETDEPARPAAVMPAPPPKPSAPFRPSALPGIVTGLGLALLLVGGGIILAKTLPPPEAPAAVATPAPAPDAKPAPDAPPTPDAKPAVDAAALTARIDGLGGDVQGLGKRLDDVQKQIADMPKPEPAPDMKAIEAKIDGLAKRVEAASPPDLKALEDKVAKATEGQAKVDAFAAQAAGLEKTIASLQDKVKSLAEAKPGPATTQPAPTASATPAAATNADADFAKAVDLYKKNQFAPARDAFTKLQEASPTDARVWYFSALTNGFVTGVWTGDTDRLVTKGVDLEKAGTPDAAKINSTFADLQPPTAKTWLDAYRARAK